MSVVLLVFSSLVLGLLHWCTAQRLVFSSVSFVLRMSLSCVWVLVLGLGGFTIFWGLRFCVGVFCFWVWEA